MPALVPDFWTPVNANLPPLVYHWLMVQAKFGRLLLVVSTGGR